MDLCGWNIFNSDSRVSAEMVTLTTTGGQLRYDEYVCLGNVQDGLKNLDWEELTEADNYAIVTGINEIINQIAN